MTEVNDGRYLRQLGIVRQRNLPPVTLIGCGGLGSPTAIALSKMGIPRLLLWDFDSVEEHNLPNTFYKEKDIGRFKVEALKETCLEFNSDLVITTRRTRFSERDMLRGIVISGVDSMASRHAIWNKIKMNPNVPLYIEGRMSRLAGIVNVVRPTNQSDIAWYESTLCSDENAIQDPCTEKAIIFSVLGFTWVVSSWVKKIANNEPIHRWVVVDSFNMSTLLSEEQVEV